MGNLWVKGSEELCIDEDPDSTWMHSYLLRLVERVKPDSYYWFCLCSSGWLSIDGWLDQQSLSLTTGVVNWACLGGQMWNKWFSVASAAYTHTHTHTHRWTDWPVDNQAHANMMPFCSSQMAGWLCVYSFCNVAHSLAHCWTDVDSTSLTFPPNWLPLWAFPPPTHIQKHTHLTYTIPQHHFPANVHSFHINPPLLLRTHIGLVSGTWQTSLSVSVCMCVR